MGSMFYIKKTSKKKFKSNKSFSLNLVMLLGARLVKTCKKLGILLPTGLKI